MRILAAMVICSPVWAQAVSLGVRGGLPIHGVFTVGDRQYSTASGFTVGPLIELHLWRGAALGADFLLSRAGLAVSPAEPRSADVWRWDLPLTCIYRFHARLRPFVRGGLSFNRVFHVSGATECARGSFGEQFYCVDGSPLAELRHRGTSGFVVGGGLRLKLRLLSLDPEVRLTRWVDRNFGVRDSAVRSNLSQLEFLVGMVF